MAKDAAQLVSMRNEFYRDNCRRITFALILMIFVNICLVGLIYFQLTHKPSPQYFAVGPDGKIIKLEPLSEPVYNPDFIREWATRVAVAVHTYDFVGYRKSFQEAQNKFTANGWINFEDALKESRELELVKAKHLVSQAVPTGAATILDKGIVNGRYTWKVQLPLLVTYDSGTMQLQTPVLATILVSRVPVNNFPEGIAVIQY